MRVIKIKPRVKVRDILKFVNDNLEVLLPLTRKGAYRMKYTVLPQWEEYAPSSVYLVADRLTRQGLVEKVITSDGIIIKITDHGRKRILRYNLANLTFDKPLIWDGLWRLVFFDIAEIDRSKRDKLRRYLVQLGMEKMQESVFISPYDVFEKVEYVREILNVSHGVKLAILSFIENQDELKKLFEL